MAATGRLRSATRPRASWVASPQCSCRPSWSDARGWAREPRRAVARGRRARRAGGDRALPDRRAGLGGERRAPAAGNPGGQPQRNGPTGTAGRGWPARRRLPARRHGGDRLLHDVLHVAVRVPPHGRGRRALDPGRERGAQPRAGRRRSGARPDGRGRLMLDDALKLTAYLGERDRCGGQLLADAVSEVCERHGVRASMLLRGIEGFGIRHRLQTERLLSLSEDLPILATALDTPVRMMAVLEDIRRITRHGLITLERVRMVDAEALDPGFSPPAGEVKLTIYLGRRERAAGRPAYMAVVDCLQRHGLDGATVLLGLDGTAHGERRRGRFLARNEHVPLCLLYTSDAA